MNTLTSVVHNNIKYVLLDDIRNKKLNEDYFTGCKTIRRCVDKHGIPDDKCLYMKNGTVFEKKYKTADLYIEEEYAKVNILDVEALKRKKQELKDAKKKKKIEQKKYDDNDIANAPPIIHLQENEMFQDEHGDPMPIEVRGEKTMDGSYFKAYDVGKAFNYNKINDTILFTNSDFVYRKHYIYFQVETPINSGGFPRDSNDTKRTLYLTYIGVMKVLFGARGDKAERFTTWATRIIFTMQMGAPQQRQELAANALEMNVNEMRTLLSTFGDDLSGLYLFKIGNVESLSQKYNIDTQKWSVNDGVYKFGKTKNIDERYLHHLKKYPNKKQQLKHQLFRLVDPMFLSQAETDLIACFRMMKVLITEQNDDNDTELVILSEDNITNIRKLFDQICKSYKGRNAGLIDKIEYMTKTHETLQEKIDDLQCCIENMKDTHINEMNEVKRSNDELLKCKEEIIKSKQESLRSKEELIKMQYDVIALLRK